MAMKKKRLLISLLLLLVTANFACAMNRRMLMIDGNINTETATEQPRKETENAVKENSETGDQPDVNNHHSIPRQKFGGWDNNPGPSNNAQTKDGNAVDNHT
ncbi:hypothetical protein PVL29_010687 [Vitis rotundifolia]|uniref:Uncharacterized protein n=1 Tax=Vitis rotundifolia TaxID=103349 RepID=A0AA38ZVW9_VITRO|nr:hypothetical protein PVL29_010687 [Vitis rotundifolia]